MASSSTAATTSIPPSVISDLLSLASVVDVTFDPNLFCVIVDLLKNGVSPDAVYAFLVQAMVHSKLGKKLRKASKQLTDKEKEIRRQSRVLSEANGGEKLNF